MGTRGSWRLMTWTGCLGQEVFGEKGELIAVAKARFIMFEPLGFWSHWDTLQAAL